MESTDTEILATNSGDLDELLSTFEYQVRIFGMSIGQKLSGSRLARLLNLLLISSMSVDFVFTIAVNSLIPTESDDLLLFPDIGHFVLNTGRHYATIGKLCFQLNSLLMGIWFYFDRLKWYHRMNNIYRAVVTVETHHRLMGVAKRCRLLSILLMINLILSIGTQQIYLLWAYADRNSRYPAIWYHHLYLLSINIYCVISPWAFFKLYLFARIGSELFVQINRQFKEATRRRKRVDRYFFQYLKQYSLLCTMVNDLDYFLARIYLILMICYLPFIAQLFYNTFWAQIGMMIKIASGNAGFCAAVLLLLFAKVIGEIDTKAKALSNRLYHQLMIKDQCRFASQNMEPVSGAGSMEQSFEYCICPQVQQYFNSTLNSFIGVRIFGNPINVNTIFSVGRDLY
jgi:hypothetical protein